MKFISKRFYLGLLLMLFCILLSACGPSPEELAATSAAQTAAAATNTPIPPTITPTPTPTHTPTPVPYDFSLLITGEEEVPIIGANVVLVEVDGEMGSQISDDVGQVYWYDLPGDAVNLSISAQGYFSKEISETITRGVNQLEINLDRDPHGLIPSEVCGLGQKILYIEDFQDGEAQGWSEQIKLRAMGWDIIPHPDSQGNLVLMNNGSSGSGVELENASFGTAVWHVQFMIDGNQIHRFEWLSKYDYTDESGHIDHSAYSVRFENPYTTLAIHREKGTSNIPLFSQGFSVKTGEWYQIDMSSFESRFDFWLNDRVLVSYKDPGPLPAGNINMGIDEVIGPEQVTYFDNLVVCELTEPYQPIPGP